VPAGVLTTLPFQVLVTKQSDSLAVLRSKLKPVWARTLTFHEWRSSSVCTRSCVLLPQRESSVTRLLADRQRPAIGLERLLVAALDIVHDGEVVERSGHVGVLGPQRLLLDRQRAFSCARSVSASASVS